MDLKLIETYRNCVTCKKRGKSSGQLGKIVVGTVAEEGESIVIGFLIVVPES